MIIFSLTKEQKESALKAILMNLETEIYHSILSIGKDPDNYNFNEIATLADIPAPSLENKLYVAYNKYLEIKQKIDNL